MKKKRKQPTFVSSFAAKLLEVGGVLLVAVLFVVLAVLNRSTGGKASAPAETPVPTPVLIDAAALDDAIQSAGFVREANKLITPTGQEWPCAVETDPLGVSILSITAPVHANLKGDSLLAEAFNAQNRAIRETLADLLESVYPVFGGSGADAVSIVERCVTVQGRQSTVSLRTDRAVLTITPEGEGVLLTFKRINDPS